LVKVEQIILCVTFLFKEITLNKKLTGIINRPVFPEISIFNWIR
jgi:hypothetical protein